MQLELRHLRYFLAVAEKLSFSSRATPKMSVETTCLQLVGKAVACRVLK